MTHRRRGRPAPPHAPRGRAARARRPRVRGAAPAQTLVSSRSRGPASEARCGAARFRRATARDAIHRRASLRMPAQRACPSARLRATLRPACWRARTTPDAVRARPSCVRHARHDGTRPRRERSTPATLRPHRAGGVAPHHSQSGAPPACSGQGMRFRPPRSAQGCVLGLPRARPERPQRAPASSGGVASRSPQPPARGRSSTRAARAWGRARRAYARPRRGARSGGGAGSRGTAHTRRSPGRRALRASPAPCRASSLASPGRASDRLFRTEGTRSTSQERLRSNEIAELRHRDASKRERRRVVAQGDPVQGAEGITRRERTRRGCDQGVHRNPVTLVTPIVSISRVSLSRDQRPPDRIEKRVDTRSKETRAMTKHRTGTRKEWLAARLELLDAEKELTRRSDELARRRQELPWVRIDKEYRFESDEGKASLADLFRGRSQLLVYHFMFGPDYKAGCPSCSAIADGFNGIAVHLANHDVMLWAVSRALLAKLQAYKRRMGWTFPWASSVGGDFNFDFNVSFSEEQQREGIEFNYQREPALQLRGNEGSEIPSRTTPDGPAKFAAMTGTDVATYTRE